MTIEALETWLESFVSHAQIVHDTRHILEEWAVNGIFQAAVEDDHFIPIPHDAPITVIRTSLEYHSVGDAFGAVKAIVALGAITIHDDTILPQYCFVRLYYNEEGHCYNTCDFYLG